MGETMIWVGYPVGLAVITFDVDEMRPVAEAVTSVVPAFLVVAN